MIDTLEFAILENVEYRVVLKICIRQIYEEKKTNLHILSRLKLLLKGPGLKY